MLANLRASMALADGVSGADLWPGEPESAIRPGRSVVSSWSGRRLLGWSSCWIQHQALNRFGLKNNRARLALATRIQVFICLSAFLRWAAPQSP